jgi:hypothetical protein
LSSTYCLVGASGAFGNSLGTSGALGGYAIGFGASTGAFGGSTFGYGIYFSAI